MLSSTEPQLLHAAVARVRGARTELEAGATDHDERSAHQDLVEDVLEQLASWANSDACSEQLGRVMLGWRDRLGSFLLAAQALDEIDLGADAAPRMLRRGLDEILDAASPLARLWAAEDPNAVAVAAGAQ